MISLDNKKNSPVLQTVSGAGVPGTASSEAKKTPVGYYSKPELWTEAEKYETKIAEEETGLTEAKTSVNAAKQRMDSLYAEAEKLQKAWETSPSDIVYAKWKITYGMYEDAVNKYNTAATVYNSRYDAVGKTYEEYTAYMADQTKQYDDWRGTVRTPEKVEEQHAAVQPLLDAATERYSEAEKTLSALVQVVPPRMTADQYAQRQKDIAAAQKEKDEALAELQKWQKTASTTREELEWAKYFSYEDLRGNADFAEKSAYAGPNDDINYAIINGKAVMAGREDVAELTENELATYNYLYATEGKAAAEEYYTWLNTRQGQFDTLNQRVGAKKAEEISKGGTPGKMAFAVAAGLDNWWQGTKQTFSGEEQAKSAYQYASEEIRKELGGATGFVYDMLNTTANMAPSILASVAVGNVAGALGASAKVVGVLSKVAGLSTMGTGVYGNAYAQKVREGYSKESSATYAALVTASELGLQAVIGGIGELSGISGSALAKRLAAIDNTWLQVAARYGLSIVREGIEEGLQEVLEPLISAAVFREDLEPAQIGDVAYAFLMGAASAGLLEGSNAWTETKKAQAQKILDEAIKDVKAGKDIDGEKAMPKAEAKAEAAPAETKVEAAPGEYVNAKGERFTENGSKKLPNGQVALPTAESEDFVRRMKNAKTDTARTGVQYGATDKQIRQAERLSKALGKKILFFSEDPTENGIKNGKHNAATDEISINVQSEKGVLWVVAHELTHSADIAPEYENLKNYVLRQMQKSGIDVDAMAREEQAFRKANGETLSIPEAKDDLVADWAADHILTDEATIVSLVKQNRTAGQKILSWIDGILAKLGSEAAEERQMLRNARDLYAKALAGADNVREQVKNQEDLRQYREYSEEDAGELDYEAYLEEESRKGVSALDNEASRWSITAKNPKEREKVLSGIRKIMENGGSAEDISRYVKEQESRTSEKTKTPQTNVRDGAAEIVRKARAEGMSVDDYLRENAELYETEDGWNADARRALKMEGGERYSVTKPFRDKQGNYYKDAVLLDTNFFDGLSTKNWGKKLKTAILTRASRNPFIMPVFDENGNETILQFAGPKERVGKNGGKDHLVLGELFSTKDNVSKLVVVHIDEIVSVSEEKNPYYTEEKLHGWLDKNGWLHRTANVINAKNGNIYNITLDIAKTKDGRTILYATNGKIKKVGNAEVNSLKIKGSRLNSNFNTMVPQTKPNVNSKKRNSFSSLSPTSQLKAEKSKEQTRKNLLARIGEIVNLPTIKNVEGISEQVQSLVDEYMETGTVSEETQKNVFDTIRRTALKENRKTYERTASLAQYIRNTNLFAGEKVRERFTNWDLFSKQAYGMLRISETGGKPVREFYRELSERAPEAFPKSVKEESAQLRRIYTYALIAEKARTYFLANEGEKRRATRKGELHDFGVAVSEAASELRLVRRYLEKQEAEPIKVPATTEEATALYAQLKDARRAKEKALKSILLTARDEMQIGRLLRGEIELDMLDPEKDNVDGIRAAYTAIAEYEKIAVPLREWKKQKRAELRELADGYLETANFWKDKKTGIQYSRETMERNVRDIVFGKDGKVDPKLAEEIVKEYFESVHKGAAAANRMKNNFRDRVKAMKISRKVAKGNLVSEAHAVQLLGEAEDNVDMLRRSNGRIKVRDGKTLNEWLGVIDKLWEENPNLDKDKIRRHVQEFRDIYDELFQMMNDVRIRNGYEPVNYRHGYFPHFQPGDGDGLLVQFGKAMGMSTEVTALPTTINGLTHTFRPGIQWFGNAQTRLGFNTAYDAVQGFDKYIEGIADVVHQTDNIQKLRALASQIRYWTTDDGIRAQVDAVQANRMLSEEEKQVQIDAIYERGKYALSNFVVELEEYTNILANKKSQHDRSTENRIGRRIYNIMKTWEGRIAANMVAINPASWITNFIPLVQGGATLDRGMLLRGMWETLQSYVKDDGMVGQSTFLTNRRGSDPLVRSWADRTAATSSKPMEWIDMFTAGSLVRARYEQNLKRGMSEAAAMDEADAWTAGVMADRSKGGTPTLFSEKNPATKLFTQFQIEVNNQLSYLFKDLPRDMREKGLAVLALALFRFLIGSFLFNELYEYVIGRRPALDPIGIVNDTVGDFTGYELPNLVELSAGLLKGETPSFKTEKQSADAALKNLGKNVAEELPFVGGLMGGGRLPISSALPDFESLLGVIKEDVSGEKRLDYAKKALSGPAVYTLLPFGGGQIKKIYEGVKAVIEGGSYSVDNEGNKRLQYPVYRDTAGEAVLSTAGAVLFGKTTLPAGREWVEGGFKTLGVKETAAYEAMMDAGVSGRDAYGLIMDIRGAEKSEGVSETEAERNILRQSSVSGEGKSIVYYGMLATDKERAVMDELAESSDMGTVTSVLMDIRDAEKQADKLSVIAKADCTEDEFEAYVGLVLGTEYTTEKGGATKFANLMEAVETGLSKEKALGLLVDGGNLEKYLSYTDAGVSANAAYRIEMAVSALEPAEGKKSVSNVQKWRAVVDTGVSESEQMKALSVLMSESEYTKVQAAKEHNITPGMYVVYKEMLSEYDLDESGSVSQAEAKKALDAMGAKTGIVLPSYGPVTASNINVTRAMRAALWQMTNKSWKPESNPYNIVVGRKVYNAIK